MSRKLPQLAATIEGNWVDRSMPAMALPLDATGKQSVGMEYLCYRDHSGDGYSLTAIGTVSTTLFIAYLPTEYLDDDTVALMLTAKAIPRQRMSILMAAAG
jgi:hypothetical protein